MATNRSYGEACGIARALDVVGERWALMVVRELLLGPQRFADLRRSLPAASSNILSDRLRELESREVVHRRALPPPAGSVVYELTASGRDLEPVLLALGAWGLQFPLPRPAPARLTATSVLLFLRGSVRPPRGAPPATYRIALDDRVWTVRTHGGRVDVEEVEPAAEDARLHTDPATLNALLQDPTALDAAIAAGAAVVGGDVAALRRLLRSAVRRDLRAGGSPTLP